MQSTIEFIGNNLLAADMHSAYDILASMFGFHPKFKPKHQFRLASIKGRSDLRGSRFQNCQVLSLFARNNEDYYSLKLCDDSMRDEQIECDERILVRRKLEAKDGDIVLAIVDGEPILRKYYRKGRDIELQSANAKHKTIFISGENDFRIAGVFAGHMR